MRESKSLALPFGDSPVRETGNVRDLSLAERSKIMRNNSMTRRALRSRTAVVRIMVSSAVERIGAVVRAVRRIPLSAAYTVNQNWRTDCNRSSPVFRLRVYYTLQK